VNYAAKDFCQQPCRTANATPQVKHLRTTSRNGERSEPQCRQCSSNVILIRDFLDGVDGQIEFPDNGVEQLIPLQSGKYRGAR
jgi:hypothetical protein